MPLVNYRPSFFHFQALETIPKLKNVIPIERAQMRIKVSFTGKEASKFREKLVKLVAKVENEKKDMIDMSMVN